MASDLTFQDLLDSFSDEVFVGRTEQLALFEKSLTAASPSFLILAISGQGGVGKTTLIEKFRHLSDSHHVAHAMVNDEETNIPEILYNLVKQFDAQEIPFKKFGDRFQKYRDLKNEVESDANAPRGLLDFALQSATKIGLRSLHRLPIAGEAADVLLTRESEDRISEEVVTLTGYLARKFSNKEDRRLLLDTNGELTKTFISDLNESLQNNRVFIFFDTYEKTSKFLDVWLRALLEGKFGVFSRGVSFVIAGRYPLGQEWTRFRGAVRQIELQRFTDHEAREYLLRSGITDDNEIGELIKLSDKLPILLAFLVSAPGNLPTDISNTAIERFLQGSTPEQKETALVASVARIFNQDIIQTVLDSKIVSNTFEWLCNAHFVRFGSNGWYYHEVVRTLMLRYFCVLSEQNYFATHKKLEEYYQMRLIGLSTNKGSSDLARKYKAEWFYHVLSQTNISSQDKAISIFLVEKENDEKFLLLCGQIAKQVAEETNSKDFEVCAERFEILSKVIIESDNPNALLQKALGITFKICELPSLNDQDRSRAFSIQGDIYLELKDFSSAIRSYSKSIELWPDNPEYYHDRAHANEKNTDTQAALADFSKAIELKPNVSRYYKCRGNCYLAAGDNSSAINDISKAIELEPDNAGAWHSRAHYYELTQSFTEAFNDLTKAIELAPDWYQHYGCRAILQLYHMNNYDGGLIDINRTIELAPTEPVPYIHRAEFYAYKQNYNAALDDLTKAIELNPDNGNIHYLRSRVQVALNFQSEAIADINKAIELEPYNAHYFHERAHLFDSFGQLDKAIRDFNRAIELEPNNADNYKCRGLFYINTQQEPLKALDDFSSAISLNSQEGELYYFRGQVYEQQENMDKALVDYNFAINIRSEEPNYFHKRGHLFEKTGNPVQAINDFTKAIELEPNRPKHYRCRGHVNFSRNNFSDALDDFSKSIQIQDTNYEDYYWHGRTQINLGNFQEAMSDFTRAIELNPKDLSSMAWRGISYIELGQPEIARNDFKNVEKINKNDPNPNALYTAATGYARMAQISKACKLLSSAFALDKNLVDRANNDEKLKHVRESEQFKQILNIDPNGSA
jgi:tetratricopeptide (TPR) repeat protein